MNAYSIKTIVIPIGDIIINICHYHIERALITYYILVVP